MALTNTAVPAMIANTFDQLATKSQNERRYLATHRIIGQPPMVAVCAVVKLSALNTHGNCSLVPAVGARPRTATLPQSHWVTLQSPPTSSKTTESFGSYRPARCP